MSRIRERHRRLREAVESERRHEDALPTGRERRRLREAVTRERRREDALVGPEGERGDPATEQGPEIEDLPLGVPRAPRGPLELPGFPRGDPTHG